MVRTLLVISVMLAAVDAGATDFRGGKAGSYARPAMAARAGFSPGFIVRARTIGVSQDGKRAYVIAADRQGEIWNIEVDRATGENTLQLKHVAHYGLMDARSFGAARENIPAEFIRATVGDVTHSGLPQLTRSHEHLRVALPGTRDGTPAANVLVGTRKHFPDGWRSASRNVRFDPADGIPSPR